MLILKNAQQFSHEMILSVNLEDGIFIDATAGNGHDTLFLAQYIDSTSKILSFDIQETAILQTRQLLQKYDLAPKVTCILDSHANISNYLELDERVRLAIFNLGYLPGSDKKIITIPSSTQGAIQILLERLEKNGKIIIVSYYGHEGGLEEKDVVEELISALPQNEWSVLKYQFINQINCPPICYVIEKK
nr:class I SAM-dependent methyltransferase [uncultured Granulicatella sp.]